MTITIHFPASTLQPISLNSRHPSTVLHFILQAPIATVLVQLEQSRAEMHQSVLPQAIIATLSFLHFTQAVDTTQWSTAVEFQLQPNAVTVDGHLNYTDIFNSVWGAPHRIRLRRRARTNRLNRLHNQIHRPRRCLMDDDKRHGAVTHDGSCAGRRRGQVQFVHENRMSRMGLPRRPKTESTLRAMGSSNVPTDVHC